MEDFRSEPHPVKRAESLGFGLTSFVNLVCVSPSLPVLHCLTPEKVLKTVMTCNDLFCLHGTDNCWMYRTFPFHYNNGKWSPSEQWSYAKQHLLPHYFTLKIINEWLGGLISIGFIHHVKPLTQCLTQSQWVIKQNELLLKSYFSDPFACEFIQHIYFGHITKVPRIRFSLCWYNYSFDFFICIVFFQAPPKIVGWPQIYCRGNQTRRRKNCCHSRTCR